MSETKQPSVHDVQTLLTQLCHALYIWTPYLPAEHRDEATSLAERWGEIRDILTDYELIRWKDRQELISLRATVKQRDIEMETARKQIATLMDAAIPKNL
jgi:hypothetical protein